MSKSFAGIAVFPTGVEEYNVSISLVSSTDGSVVDTKSSSSPSKITSLSETVKSVLSNFPEPTTISSYITSVPPAFPADRFYEVYNALDSAKLIDEDEYAALPVNHGEAYAATLPKGKTTTIIALDFPSTDHLYSANVSSTEKDGKRENTVSQELSVSFDDNASFQVALEKIQTSPEESNKVPDQILLIKPTTVSNEAKAIDIDALVAGTYPNVPVSIATANNIAQAAASLAYANSLLPVRHIRAQYVMPLPVSVATASGAVVPLAPPTYRIPAFEFITLTNSVDNQKSVTVRLLLGNHGQAKENLQRAVAVLDDLKPLPKGEACIKVSINVEVLDGWREAAKIVVEQQDGPKKTFLFPRFFANLPEDYEKYEIRGKKDTSFEQQSDKVVGELPE